MPEVAQKTSPPTVDRKKIQQRILEALQCQIEGPKVTRTYVIALMAVACAMLLLPAAYVGMISLIGYAVYWNAVHLSTMVQHGQSFGLSHTASLLTVIFGPIVMLFAIKPFFAGSPKLDKPERLKPEIEPFLFEYVDAVADAVGAPRPTSIRIDTEVNASAGLRRGLASFFSNDLTLTLGLPLVQGLTVRELTGVLAHEFGHFSQAAGMRFGYIIRIISMWFIRVTFERDAWDEFLAGMGERMGWPWKIFVLIAHFFIYLTRVALFGLTWLGNAISYYLMRQQEFDADVYESRLVGPGFFASTSRKLHELGLAYYMAVNDLRRSWEDGRLANDMPAVVAANCANITPKIRKELRKQRRKQKTGLFDSHPSDHERIARANQEPGTPAMRVDEAVDESPATVLFQEFTRLSRAASTRYYEAVLGDDFDEKKLCPAKRVIQDNAHELQAFKALDRFFQTRIPLMRPLPIDESAKTKPKSSEEANDLAKTLKLARKRMGELLPKYKQLVERHDQAEQTVFLTAAAQQLIDCGLAIRAKNFSLADARPKAVDQKLDRARKGLQQIAADLLEYETEASTRLSTALQLVQLDAITNRIPKGAELRKEVNETIPDAAFVGSAMGNLLPMRILYHRLLCLTSQLRREETRQDLIESILESMEKLSSLIERTSKSLGNRAYPFEHGLGGMTIREYALPVVPDERDLWGMVAVTSHLLDKLSLIQVRLFARLANAVEQVETAIGLPLLPDPKYDEDEAPSDDDD